jgi:arylsulfatase A-like enzyme
MQRAFDTVSLTEDMKPNVLLVVLDTVRAKSCSFHGRDRATTPGLESLCDESVVFKHAIAPDTWTLPSHGAMFSGKYPTEVGVHAENMLFPANKSTLAEELSADGYATGIFSSNPFLTEGSGLNRGFNRSHTSGIQLVLYDDAFDPSQYIRSREHDQGLAKWMELGRELVDPPQTVLKSVLNAINYKYQTTWGANREDPYDPSSDDGATESITAFVSWLENTGEPFFGCLNFMEAHTPYRYRDRFLPDWATMQDVKVLSQNRWQYLSGELELSTRRKELFQSLYEAELFSLDDILQSLWEVLKERGHWDETLVIVTSDHGELLGEHDLLFHDMNRLVEPLLHVPLIVKYPDSTYAGTTVTETTSLTRLPAIVHEVTDEDQTPDPNHHPCDLVKAEFVGMNQVLPDERYANVYDDLNGQSRAVYEDGTKYVLYEDHATVTQDLPVGAESGVEPIESIEVENVPERVREFAGINEDVTSGRQLEVNDAVSDRLKQLGYR